MAVARTYSTAPSRVSNAGEITRSGATSLTTRLPGARTPRPSLTTAAPSSALSTAVSVADPAAPLPVPQPPRAWVYPQFSVPTYAFPPRLPGGGGNEEKQSDTIYIPYIPIWVYIAGAAILLYALRKK